MTLKIAPFKGHLLTVRGSAALCIFRTEASWLQDKKFHKYSQIELNVDIIDLIESLIPSDQGVFLPIFVELQTRNELRTLAACLGMNGFCF